MSDINDSHREAESPSACLTLDSSPLAAESLSELPGIRETPGWEGRTRTLLLCDAFGASQAEVRLPDRNLTPRGVAILRELLKEIEREQRFGSIMRLE